MFSFSEKENSLDSYFRSLDLNRESERKEMRDEWLRLISFSTFPLNSTSHSPIRLARSGFYYTGRNQECVCFSCGVHNSDWTGSSVTDIHTRLCSECRHLNGHDVTNIPIGSNNSSQSSHLLSESSKRKSSNKNAEQRVLENVNGSQNTTHTKCQAPNQNQRPSIPRSNNVREMLEPLGINFYRPKYPSYSVLATRMSSYQQWPSYLTQTPKDRSIAGFFYVGYGDYVRCFFCRGGLRNWEPCDDAWLEHARWFPKCSFLRQNRGVDFVTLVQSVQNEQVSETVTVEELIDAILADKVTPPNPSEGNSQDIETNPQSPSLPADVDEPSRIYTANSTANADLSNEPKALSLKDETEVLLDENRRLKEQRICRILPDASEKEDIANNSFSTFAQQTRGTVFLCFLCSPLAEGSSLDEGQHNQKAVSEIHLNTLETVSHCPNVSDYIRKASDKCAKVCGSYIQNGDCAYHCMRDSSKTSLVEFCAKPKVLFDFCPEYDPIGQRFQKDIFTLCNPSTPIQRHYNSSDIFFCDPGNCRQLKEAGVLRTDLTRLVTENTPINSGDMNDGWSSQHWILLLLLMAVFAFFVFLCIFLMRKHLSAWFQRMTKRRNRNDILDGEVFLDKMQK